MKEKKMPDLLDTATAKPLKIHKLVSENVKRLKVVSITPDGNLVQITGPNGAGKTSVLSSIFWALAGAGVVQASPIRKDEEFATIKLDLGEFIVTRRFQKTDDGDFTTSIKVTSPDGAQYSKPQQILDGLAGRGGMAFDPFVFARAKPKEQFEMLKGLVPGASDFERIDGLNRADFDKRTSINREAAQKKAQANAIAIPEATPKERVDETAIVDEIAAVGEHNALIERRQEGRAAVAKEAETFRAAAAEARKRAVELRRQAEVLDEQATSQDAEAAAREEKLAKAEPLPEPKDAAAIKAKLEDAKRTNAAVDQALRRETLQAEARNLEQQAEALTARIAARNEEKRAAIAAAKMPVQGLGFGEDFITFNGVPFNQASDAEQLRASIAIAMAANPRLKVILVRDGSLLDKKSMALLAEMADAKGCQVWIESVDDSGEVGIVMEDGAVASTPATRRGRQQARAQAAE
jgi:energy-coupling factor transporter ATP-binding protein EcfA2